MFAQLTIASYANEHSNHMLNLFMVADEVICGLILLVIFIAFMLEVYGIPILLRHRVYNLFHRRTKMCKHCKHINLNLGCMMDYTGGKKEYFFEKQCEQCKKETK